MSAPSTIRRLLQIDEVAELFNVSAAAIRMQRHRKTEPGSLGFLCGKRVMFDPADLEDYLARRKADRDRVAP